MDYLWSPWRYRYVSSVGESPGCFLCDAAAQNQDAENYIVHRGRLNFIILNRYPYTSGHLMVVPYQHVGILEELPEDALVEMMRFVRQAEIHLRAIYRPEGLNLGMNIGRCAGAGVADHIHMHVLPRWMGDSSFMTTVGETRVLPEELPVTYQKLLRAFQGNRTLDHAAHNQ